MCKRGGRGEGERCVQQGVRGEGEGGEVLLRRVFA